MNNNTPNNGPQNGFGTSPDSTVHAQTPPQSIPDPQKPTDLSVRNRPADILLAWGSLVLGFLFWQMRAFQTHPFGIFLTFAAVLAAGAIYFRCSGVKGSPQSHALNIITFLFSVSLITNGNAYVRGLVILLLIFVFPYRIAVSCGISEAGMLSNGVFKAVFTSIGSLAFHHIKDFFTSLFCFRRKIAGTIGRTVKWILLGLAAALIPTLIIILLLSYDSQFTDLLTRMFDFSIDWKDVTSVILAVPTGMLLFGILYTAERRAAGEPSKTVRFGSAKILPCLLLCAAVTPVLLVYVLFFVSQMPYYLSAFTGTLPEALSYADYARSGFFQLCAVSEINAVMLILFSVFMKEGGAARNTAKRIYSAILSVFTLILIATALSKMALYIDSYGLTQKRVYASWLMLLLGAAFILVLLHQIFPKLRFTAALVIILLVFTAAVTLPNVDAMIADYNVNAYIKGDLPTVDVCMLDRELNESAVPALVRLHEHLKGLPDRSEQQESDLSQTQATLERMKQELTDRPFTSFTIPTLIARKALNSAGF